MWPGRKGTRRSRTVSARSSRNKAAWASAAPVCRATIAAREESCADGSTTERMVRYPRQQSRWRSANAQVLPPPGRLSLPSRPCSASIPAATALSSGRAPWAGNRA
ncbi:hypothetical protein ABZ467_03760 [Streptomyces sp. NPDC005727]|uniref:hypothetical protein n=1 Tax=Streptomyces sp. NPDC005727 TaxID=3157053 RepID=UPI0033F1763B